MRGLLCALGLSVHLVTSAALAAEPNSNEAKLPQKGAGIDFSPGEDPSLKRFRANHWTHGLHFFAGLGTNTAFYRLDDRQSSVEVGLGEMSAASYVVSPDWMVEVTSQLGFRRDQSFFIWDTNIAPGVKYRIPWLGTFRDSSFYGRGLVGWGMEVLYPHGVSERIHYSGPVGGIGFGFLHGKAQQTLWFLDALAYLHVFQKRDVVDPGGDAPMITSRSSLANHVWVAFAISVGILIL